MLSVIKNAILNTIVEKDVIKHPEVYDKYTEFNEYDILECIIRNWLKYEGVFASDKKFFNPKDKVYIKIMDYEANLIDRMNILDSIQGFLGSNIHIGYDFELVGDLMDTDGLNIARIGLRRLEIEMIMNPNYDKDFCIGYLRCLGYWENIT